MNRLYLAPEQLAAGEILLQPEQTHYLRDVLRLTPGAELEVFDGRGGRWHATLVAAGTVRLSAKLPERARSVDVVVAQALAKGEKMDFVVQKCTELGASRIVPFAAERSVLKLDTGRAARWQKIAQEAARQSGRADVPDVDPPCPFEALVTVAAGRRAVLLDPQAPQRLGEVVRGADRVLLVIGPEGGLTEGELSTPGFSRASLGSLVLRTETAALAALSVILHLHGELG